MRNWRGLRGRWAPITILLPPLPRRLGDQKYSKDILVEGLRSRREISKMEGCRESDACCLKIE